MEKKAEIFSEEFIASIKKASNYFERGFITFLATKERLKSTRDSLEQIMTYYPKAKKKSILKRIRSLNDEECFSAISELYIFRSLKSQFHTIEVEPNLGSILENDKTPDFWVKEQLLFEVATVFLKEKIQESILIELINEIKSKTKIIYLNIRNLPKETPKLSIVKNEFESLLEEHKNISKITSFNFRSRTGILFYGNLIKIPNDSPIVAGVGTSYGFNDEDYLYQNSIRNTIKKKLKKYSRVSKQGYPLVLVIYNRNEFLNDEFWDEVVNGTKVYHTIAGTNNPNLHYKRVNTLYQTASNTSLSATLVSDHKTIDNYILFKNPYAKSSINDFEEKIKKAFKVREINLHSPF